MEIIRKGEFDTHEEFIMKQFPKDDPVVYEFEVAAIDHEVKNLTTPTLYVSRGKMLLSYDGIYEIYLMRDTILTFTGAPPTFKAWAQFLKPGKSYTRESNSINELRDDEFETKFSIDEEGSVPKDFILRNDHMIKRNYQTWAMGRLIIDIKSNIQPNPTLQEMVNGDFVVFNQKTVLYFIITTVVFFLIKLLVTPSLPGIVDTILDVLFALFLVIMGLWLYLSYSKNLKRYENVYRDYFRYQQEENIVT